MKLKNKASQLLFREKHLKLIKSLQGEKSVSILAKEINMTYSHMTNVLIAYKKEGFITSRKTGRVRLIKLTEKGEELKKSVLNILRISEEIK